MNKRQEYLAENSNQFKTEDSEARNGYNSQWTIELYAKNEFAEWELVDEFRSYDPNAIALKLKSWKDKYNVIEVSSEWNAQ